MQPVNAPLTLWTQRFEDRAGRFIRQAQTILLRAASIALAAARSFYSRVETLMDDIDRRVMERIYERRMAVRAFFLENPRDQHSNYTPKGRKVLAHWARHAHALAPISTTDPMAMARAEGKRELFALIIADLFDDLPDFARLMAQEEARQLEEIVSA